MIEDLSRFTTEVNSAIHLGAYTVKKKGSRKFYFNSVHMNNKELRQLSEMSLVNFVQTLENDRSFIVTEDELYQFCNEIKSVGELGNQPFYLTSRKDLVIIVHTNTVPNGSTIHYITELERTRPLQNV